MFKNKVMISSILLLSLLVFSGCTEDKKETKEKVVKPKVLLPVEFIDTKKEKLPIWKRFNGTTKASNRPNCPSKGKRKIEKNLF